MTLNITKIKKIVELYNLGFSQRAIADNVKTSKTTVNKYIKSNYGNQLINPVPVANKTSLNKWQVVDISHTSPIQPLPYNPMDPQIPYQQNYVGYGNNSFRDQMMSDEQIQQQQFEEERLERERNWKHAQQIDAEIKSLKQKFEEDKSREREKVRMNQLQHKIEMLKIDNKYLKNSLESKPLAQIDNSALKVMNEKENEKKYTVLKPILVREEIKNQENAEIDTIAKESDVFQNNKGQDTKDATVDLEVVPESSNIENDFESNEDTIEVEIPIWVPIVIGSVCKIIKKGMNFLDTPECKLPTSSPEYRKKLAECLRNNN